MHTYYTLLIVTLLVGCASNKAAQYPYVSGPLEKIGLSCNNNEALKVAKIAALKKYPSVEEKLNKYGFSIFRSFYSGEQENYPHKYSLKSVFYYYPVGRPEEGKSFEESLTVLLTKECKVIEVHYSKGIGQVTY